MPGVFLPAYRLGVLPAFSVFWDTVLPACLHTCILQITPGGGGYRSACIISRFHHHRCNSSYVTAVTVSFSTTVLRSVLFLPGCVVSTFYLPTTASACHLHRCLPLPAVSPTAGAFYHRWNFAAVQECTCHRSACRFVHLRFWSGCTWVQVVSATCLPAVLDYHLPFLGLDFLEYHWVPAVSRLPGSAVVLPLPFLPGTVNTCLPACHRFSAWVCVLPGTLPGWTLRSGCLPARCLILPFLPFWVLPAV